MKVAYKDLFKIQYGEIYIFLTPEVLRTLKPFKIQYGEIYIAELIKAQAKTKYLKSNMERFILE